MQGGAVEGLNWEQLETELIAMTIIVTTSLNIF
jgi:hypothetical protein